MNGVRTISIVISLAGAIACQSKRSDEHNKAKPKPVATSSNHGSPKAHTTHPGDPHGGGAKPVVRAPSRLPPPSFIDNPQHNRDARAAITLSVDAKSWRGNQPYDVAGELTKRLRHAGVDVTTDATRAWANVALKYEEARGPKHAGKPAKGDADTHETKLLLDITVKPVPGPWNEGLKPAKASNLSIRAKTGKTVVQSVYRSALDSLRMAPEYQVLPAWIGAAAGHVGSRRAIARLHLKPLDTTRVLASLGYEAKTDEERAYKLIGEGKFEACVKLGKAALPALAHFIGAKWGEKKDAALIVRATNAIVKIKSDESRDTLVTLLAQALSTFQRQPRDTTLRLLEAVAARPSLASLPVIALLERHWTPAIAKAAGEARMKIAGTIGLTKGQSGVFVATFRHDEAPKVLDVEPLLAAALKNAGIVPVDDIAKAGTIIIARNTAVAVLDVASGRIIGPITPRSASVRGFSRAAWYRGLDAFIGCSIGKCTAPIGLEALLTDPSNSWVAPGLMKSAGYTPPGQPDADFLLAVSGDFAALEKLGQRGAIAIDRVLRHRSRFAPDLPLIRRAAAALVRMNARDHSERIAISARALAVRLPRDGDEPELEQAVIELIGAFETIGKAQWMHRLRDLGRHHNENVRRASLKARAALKARVQ